MEHSEKKTPKGEITGKMLKILLDHPTSSKEFEVYGIKRRTANHNLKKFKKWDIVERREDDKFILINYSYNEYKIKTTYEIEKIKKNIIWKSWINENFHMRDFKKWCFEKGIGGLKYTGIDRYSFSNLLNNQNMPPINEVSEFSKTFSTLVIRVEEIIEGGIAHYIFNWNEETKELVGLPLHNRQDQIEPWDDGGEIPLLKRLDVNKYNKYRDLLEKESTRDYALSEIYNLTHSCFFSYSTLIDVLVLLKDYGLPKKIKI